MLKVFKYFYKKLKSLMKRLKSLGVGKNLLFIFGICFVAYHIKNHPIPISSSDFLKNIDKKSIENVNILSDTILFSSGDHRFFTNTSEAFNNTIVDMLV